VSGNQTFPEAEQIRYDPLPQRGTFGVPHFILLGRRQRRVAILALGWVAVWGGIMGLVLPIVPGTRLLPIDAVVFRVRVDSQNTEETCHPSPGRWPSL